MSYQTGEIISYYCNRQQKIVCASVVRTSLANNGKWEMRITVNGYGGLHIIMKSQVTKINTHLDELLLL